MEDIPLLSVGDNPRNNLKRVEEEIKVFNIWKKYNPSIPFNNLRYAGGLFLVDVDCKRLFNQSCMGRKTITITILIPTTYPMSFPRLAENPRNPSDELFRKMINKTARYPAFMCIPRIQALWWHRNRPYAGIAHFLNIFLIWYSIVTKRSLKYVPDFYSELSIVV